MGRKYPHIPFERYADDVICHCRSEAQAKHLKAAIEERLATWRLELHPQKTKIVFCKSGSRTGSSPSVQFDFLGYSFRPRLSRSRDGRFFVGFNPAIKGGGNAIDAAVAVGYALAVTDPCCGNIGGGGFMLIHHAAGGDTFINFRERAPFAARKDMYLDAHGKVVKGRSTAGWLAVGVPGTVAGLERARVEYGTRSRDDLLAPAIALARDGFVLSPGDVDLLAPRAPAFAKQPNVA